MANHHGVIYDHVQLTVVKMTLAFNLMVWSEQELSKHCYSSWIPFSVKVFDIHISVDLQRGTCKTA